MTMLNHLTTCLLRPQSELNYNQTTYYIASENYLEIVANSTVIRTYYGVVGF